MLTTKFLFASVACVLVPVAVQAHHSPAAFDMSREIVLEGTVVELDWKNPHIYLTLEITGPDGVVRRQEAEAAPVGSVLTYGVRREHLEPGSRIVLRANPSRREGGIVRALSFAASDGSVLLLDAIGSRSVSFQGPTVPAEGVGGKWALPPAAFLARVLVQLPLTPPAAAARAQARQAPGAEMQCGKESPPPFLGPTLYGIEVSNEAVVIRADGEGDSSRRISLIETAHPADLELSVKGHSIGRWEGETLVVDTVGFVAQVSGRGLPLGPATHLVERFSVSDDRLHLIYDVRIEDPDNLLEPVTYSMQWDHRPELEFSGLECDAEIDARYLQER